MVEDDCRYDPTLDGQSHSPEGRGLSRSDLRVQNVVHVLNMRGAAISLVYKKRSCLARRK